MLCDLQCRGCRHRGAALPGGRGLVCSLRRADTGHGASCGGGSQGGPGRQDGMAMPLLSVAWWLPAEKVPLQTGPGVGDKVPTRLRMPPHPLPAALGGAGPGAGAVLVRVAVPSSGITGALHAGGSRACSRWAGIGKRSPCRLACCRTAFRPQSSSDLPTVPFASRPGARGACASGASSSSRGSAAGRFCAAAWRLGGGAPAAAASRSGDLLAAGAAGRQVGWGGLRRSAHHPGCWRCSQCGDSLQLLQQATIQLPRRRSPCAAGRRGTLPQRAGRGCGAACCHAHRPG